MHVPGGMHASKDAHAGAVDDGCDFIERKRRMRTMNTPDIRTPVIACQGNRQAFESSCTVDGQEIGGSIGAFRLLVA
jgi:hypothetical protein